MVPVLLAGWCEGFYDVRVLSEAITAYVVLVLSACWIREVSTQYFISIKCTSRLFGCMSLNFIARRYALAAPSTRLVWVALLAFLADLVWYVYVEFCLGRGCWVGVTMIATGLLNSRCWCALRLEGKSQTGIISNCVSSEGRVMPCCAIFSQLPTSACASRHAPCVCTLFDSF